MEEGWTVPRIAQRASAHEFASQFEERNMPVVYEGAITGWPAFTKWNPDNGGLDYLKRSTSDAFVQVMLSASGSKFYGDIRSHERVSISFRDFIDYASKAVRIDSKDLKVNDSSAGDTHDQSFTESHLYLAQAPIFNKEQQEQCSLQALLQDISIGQLGFLDSDSVTNINLWMTARESKSSTHYDPYHNILCVVAGSKQITLWPPSALPFLYPHPIHGEASNHSAVDFLNPDYKKYPLYASALPGSQEVMLQSGDALFIPEGWFHQVNSESLTIAVNLWWPSSISMALDSHMDGYYLRRIVSSLLDREKERIIRFTCNKAGDTEAHKQESSKFNQGYCPARSDPVKGTQKRTTHSENRELEKQFAFELLTPLQKCCLQHLCTYSNSNTAPVQEEQTPIIGHSRSLKGDDEGGGEYVGPKSAGQSPGNQVREPLIGLLEKDVAAEAFSILDPVSLKELLLVMVKHFPRTLEVLILHKLTPLAAELLTRKFDEIDKVLSEVEQEEFYKVFYSVFEDPQIAMAQLLDKKEVFSATALKSVLERYLG